MKLVLAGLFAAAALAPSALGARPPLTHDRLVARADAICVRYASLLAAPPGVDTGLGSPAYDRAWLRLFEAQRRELAALRPAAAADRVSYRRFLESLPPVRDAFRAFTRAIERGLPVRTWRPLSRRFREAEQRAGRRARDAGLRRCFARR